MDQFDEKYRLMLDMFSSPDWKVVKESNGVVTEKGPTERGEIACFRSTALINADPHILINILWEDFNSIERLQNRDKDVIEYQILQKKENKRISYQVNKLPWPLWPREVLYITHKIIGDNVSYLLSYSIKSSKVPNNPKYVRAHVTIAAYSFTKIVEDNGRVMCHMSRISHVDPMGSIPVPIVNSFVDKNAIMVTTFKKIYG